MFAVDQVEDWSVFVLVELGLLCLVLAIGYVVLVLFVLTLRKILNRVSPGNRRMEPGLVWLTLIPLVNVVWVFFLVTRIPDSLRREFKDQERDDGTDYGKKLGLAFAILVAALVPIQFFIGPVTNSIAVLLLLPLASLVLFILFWVKIARYSARLAGPRKFVAAEDGEL
jgi:hypothetical protein